MLLAKDVARQRVDERCRGNHDVVPGSTAQPFVPKNDVRGNSLDADFGCCAKASMRQVIGIEYAEP